MKKKDLDYIDSKLNEISIKDFVYKGNRHSKTNPVFVFEHKVNDNEFYAIVLNGESGKKVEIQAETSYKSGADEYIDKIASLGSWNEIFDYLKNGDNLNKIANEVKEKYEYHQKVKAKTAKIAKNVALDFIKEYN